MRPKEFDIDPVDADPDGICAAQTPAGAEALTLDGALVSGGSVTLDYARRLAVVSDGNESGETFTVVGTDPDGYSITEVITGPNIGTVESTEYFKTVASVTISGAGAGNITVGTVDEICTRTIPIQHLSAYAAKINVDVTGTINFSVEETYDDVQRPGYAPQSAYQNAQWLAISALASKSADTTSTAATNTTAIRLKVNSYTSTAEIQMNLLQTPMGY